MGSGLSFSDRGARELKGVPGEWRLFAVSDAEAEPPTVEPERVPMSSRAMIAMARRSPKMASRMVRMARGRGEHAVRAEA